MKYISVDREAISRNAARGTNEPVLIVEFDDGSPPLSAYAVEWDGPSRLVYDPTSTEGRLNSAWIETEAELRCKVVRYHENGPDRVRV